MTIATWRAPKHLRASTRRWAEGIARDYNLDGAHYPLLQAAGEVWDRLQEAREHIASEGAVVQTKSGASKASPWVAIERDSRLAFCRVVRELGLAVEDPDDSRPPYLQGRYR